MEGHKVSSRYLDRTLKKAQLSKEEKIMGKEYLDEKLKEMYTLYYTAKSNAAGLRKIFLHTLAEAWAEKRNQIKARVYKNSLWVENQRATAKKL